MKVERWCPVMLVLSVMWGLACGQEVAPFEEASVVVEWSVMPLGCESAGVKSVEVKLENERNTYAAFGDCAMGKAVIDDVVPGRYEIDVYGEDAAGRVVFEGGIDEFDLRPGADMSTGVVELEPLPGMARVSWEFGAGADCASANAGRVEIMAYDGGYHEVGRAVARCGEGRAVLEELRAGQYLVYGRTIGGHERYEGVTKVELGRAEAVDVAVELVEVEVQ